MKFQIIRELNLTISNEKFINGSRLSTNRFLRNRGLPFHLLIWIILQKTNQGLQVCLDTFFGFDGLKSVTKSAFTQARASLCPQVFRRLNRIIMRHFYSGVNFVKWKEFCVLAVDGSTLQLPGDHRSLRERFSYHRFGPKADAGHRMSRISYLYDVFNGIVSDAQMMSYTTCRIHFMRSPYVCVKKGDLLPFDRYTAGTGYASFECMFTLTAKGCHFVFRMKDNRWKCVDTFIKSGLNEQVGCLSLPKQHNALLKTYPHLPATLPVRLFRKVNRKGEVQVFCTSLLDREQYSRKAIITAMGHRRGL